MKKKTIKSEFGRPLSQLISLSGRAVRRPRRRRGGIEGKNPTGLLATASPHLLILLLLLHMSETFAPLRLQEAQGKFP